MGGLSSSSKGVRARFAPAICACLLVVTGLAVVPGAATVDVSQVDQEFVPVGDPVVISKTPKAKMSPVSWIYTPQTDGDWRAALENQGFKSVVLEVIDIGDGNRKIFHQVVNLKSAGAYPTGSTVSDVCPMLAMHEYKLVAKDFNGPVGSSMVIQGEWSPEAEPEYFLNEEFTSWDTLDPGWVIENNAHWDPETGQYFENWFDIVDGQLSASNNGVLIFSDYLSYATWTGPIVYDDAVTISLKIYLPLNYNQKIGWAGQAFWLIVEDTSGAQGLVSRWVSDSSWDTWPIGFMNFGYSVNVQICKYSAGWHTVSWILSKTSDRWTAVFDGTVFPGLEYADARTGGFDIGRIQIINALREEVQIILVDDLRVEEGAIIPPPPPPPPPIEGYVATTIPNGHFMNMMPVSTPYGPGVHVDTIGSDDLGYEFMGVSEATFVVGPSGTVSVSGYFRLFDTLPPDYQVDRRFVRLYVVDEATKIIIANTYILDWNDAVGAWYYREVSISGLEPGTVVKVGIGRGDMWEIDRYLTAEWAGVQIQVP